MGRNIVERMVDLQMKGYYRIPHFILSVFGLEIPPEVQFSGGGCFFVHRAPGTVLHPKTKIGANVQIYQNVTIGKSRPWDGLQKEGGCIVEDDVILCAGAKVIFSEEPLIIGRGTVVGANSVLTSSTGEYEIWAGIPARKVGNRKR